MKRKEKTVHIYNWIRQEMEAAEQCGISVEVDGVRYTSRDNGELLRVLEDAPYMKEYLDDERGKIIQINFNPIKEK